MDHEFTLFAEGTFFPRRQCVTLVRPADNEETLQNLADAPPEKLRPEFREQMAALRADLVGGAEPKTHAGCALTGAGFVALLKAYVAAINSGGVPAVEGAWQAAITTQCERSLAGALSAFEDAVEDLTRTRLPLEAEELEKAFEEIRLTACRAFKQAAPAGGPARECM